MVLFPSSAVYAAEIAPPGRSGQFLGLYGMTFGLALAIGPALGTATLQHFGPRTL